MLDITTKLTATLAGRYAIEREIGAGGMATVYLARDLRHNREVALKVLHPELSAVLGTERFLKEIELTANLQHPHILPLFESGEAEGLLYYVMPYVEGESLRARLERERQLPVAHAVRIATEVAGALEYAHHRRRPPRHRAREFAPHLQPAQIPLNTMSRPHPLTSNGDCRSGEGTGRARVRPVAVSRRGGATQPTRTWRGWLLRPRIRQAAAGAAAAILAACATAPSATDPPYDVLLRGGTVIDGSGAPGYRGDVGVRAGRIAAVGDLRNASARTVFDVTRLYVAPGFLNLHSHATAAGLRTAENMLTQGVTTEILNADGGGPIDVAQQLQALDSAGLALNVGACTGFNAAWSSVMGNDDRRPSPAQVDSMSGILVRNLDEGAWCVSAGLDYHPAAFARESEVVEVVRPAARYRTIFTNHERVTSESGFSGHAGMQETIRIAHAAGLTPVITHMKLQGHEQGTADSILGIMSRSTAAGQLIAADAYPYLAGQTSLAALIIPGWAQEGGDTAMLRRFSDPALRARIIAEAEVAMHARFGGPAGVYLPGTRQELAVLMREWNVGAGEAVLRVLQEGNPTAILRFGAEEDLVRILQHPTTSIACDCGASVNASHPRGFGTYPRVLGRYVREGRVLSWEEAVRKMTSLPAALIGMTDRGLIAPGMAADIVVFDPSSVIDHATFEEPNRRSEGMLHVLVNGVPALQDGRVTGAQAGRALRRAEVVPPAERIPFRGSPVP